MEDIFPKARHTWCLQLHCPSHPKPTPGGSPAPELQQQPSPPALCSATCCWRPPRLHCSSVDSFGIYCSHFFLASKGTEQQQATTAGPACPPLSCPAVNELWQPKGPTEMHSDTPVPGSWGSTASETKNTPLSCPKRDKKWSKHKAGIAETFASEDYIGGEQKWLL